MNHIIENHFWLAFFAIIGVATVQTWASTLLLDAITMRYAYLVRKTYPEAKLESLVLCRERTFYVKVDEGFFLNCESPLEAWRAAWERIKLEENLPE